MLFSAAKMIDATTWSTSLTTRSSPQVGFNAGNGSSAYPYTPYSQTMYIRDLTSTGMANGFPGRHIFRVDEKILAGNCRHELCAYRGYPE